MVGIKKFRSFVLGILMAGALVVTGCSSDDVQSVLDTPVSEVTEAASNIIEGTIGGNESDAGKEMKADNGMLQAPENAAPGNNANAGSASDALMTLPDASDIFSERDLEQEADLSGASTVSLTSGENVNISSEGVYVITGTATDTTIIVDAADTDKVQLVLDSVNITNSTMPAIYVKSADKVFVTTAGSESTLKVNGTFSADGDTNTDAVIYSKSDLVLNGKGTLNISSTANGVSGKDDLKITGGSYVVAASEDAFEANDSIAVYNGSFDITSKKDAFHSENSDDDTKGYVYIKDGTFKISATDDGVQATSYLMIDGGTLDITGAEGLEGTYVQINGGTIKISASDDGINATQKSSAYNVVIEVNGGDITVAMGSGDTDGFDANGYIYINGGTIDVTGNSAFDFDRAAELNGGTVTVNGEQITTIENSMMGGGMGGKMGGFGGHGNMQDGQMPGGFGGKGNRQGGHNGNTQGGQMTPPDAAQMVPPSEQESGTQVENGNQNSGNN